MADLQGAQRELAEAQRLELEARQRGGRRFMPREPGFLTFHSSIARST